MTQKEFRETPEYAQAVQKIKNYRKDFKFTIYFSDIPNAKANALRIVLKDCEKQGLIESIAMGLSLELEVVEETYRRL